jgi:hypothetical protein
LIAIFLERRCLHVGVFLVLFLAFFPTLFLVLRRDLKRDIFILNFLFFYLKHAALSYFLKGTFWCDFARHLKNVFGAAFSYFLKRGVFGAAFSYFLKNIFGAAFF